MKHNGLVELLSWVPRKNFKIAVERYNLFDEFLSQFGGTFPIEYYFLENNETTGSKFEIYGNYKLREFLLELKNSIFNINHKIKLVNISDFKQGNIKSTAYGRNSSFILDIDGLILNFPRCNIGKLENELIYKADNFSIIYDINNENHTNSIIPEIERISQKTFVNFDTEKVSIGFLTIDYDGQLFLDTFDIEERAESIVEPDLHYGEGFGIYYEKLLDRISSNDKGIVIFHGDPGTGKTYCIRNIIKDLSKENKLFVYVSNDLISQILDPKIMKFLADEVENLYDEKKKNIVLILEDAESVLASRDKHIGTSVNSILNLSDGILNDVLKFQIIATFNMDADIDQALFRSGRLISKKKFRKVPPERAKKLAEFIGVEIENGKELSLADIYALKKENEVLLHVEDEKEQDIISKKEFIL